MIETAKGETKGMENVENERKLDFPVGKWFVFIDGRQLYISDIGTVDGAFFCDGVNVDDYFMLQMAIRNLRFGVVEKKLVLS